MAASSEQERLLRERIAHFLAGNDEDNIITDLWKLNGKTGTSSVQERRHGSFLYLPFVISIRELIGRIMKRRPAILVPSTT